MAYSPTPMDYINQSGDLIGAQMGYDRFSRGVAISPGIGSVGSSLMASNNAKDKGLSQLITLTYNNQSGGNFTSISASEARKYLEDSYSNAQWGPSIRQYLVNQLQMQASKGKKGAAADANKVLTEWMWKVAPQTRPEYIAQQAQMAKPKTEAELAAIAAKDLDRILGMNNPIGKTFGLPAGVSNDIDERRQLITRGITKHFMGIQPSQIQPVSQIPGPELEGK